VFRKGSILIRKKVDGKKTVVVLHVDIFPESFWKENPKILNEGFSAEPKSKAQKEAVSELDLPDVSKKDTKSAEGTKDAKDSNMEGKKET
jgi:hypothetical protein